MHSAFADGTPWILFGKHDGVSWLRFPELVDFVIQPDQRSIVAYAPDDFPRETLTHLLLDQVLPRVAALDGALVLHASGIVINHHAVAFLGPTGVGKSTLVASLCQRGFPLIADDCLALEITDQRIKVHPGYPSLRLWRDSAAQMAEMLPAVGPVAHYTDKRRVDVSANSVPFCDQLLPLAGAYVISSPDDSAQTIERSPLSPREALLAMLAGTFRLETGDPHLLVHDLDDYIEIAETIPFYALHYPRDYALLPAVHDIILSDQV